MAASPDWRTWFPAPGWMPRDAEAACRAATGRLRASGMRVEQRQGKASFLVQEPASSAEARLAIRVDFRLDAHETLRLRYRPSSSGGSWAWRLVAPLTSAAAALRPSPRRWALALRVDRALRT